MPNLDPLENRNTYCPSRGLKARFSKLLSRGVFPVQTVLRELHR